MTGAAIAAALSTAAPLEAQTTAAPTRDGQVEKAIQDTIAASLKRRGYQDGDPIYEATANAVRAAINQATAAGSTATGIQTPNRTWAETLKGWMNDLTSGLTWPLTLGKDGSDPGFFPGGGTFGGAGASGSWGDPDCADLKVEFDPGGYLIIPSFSLEVGMPLTFGANRWARGGYERAMSNQAVVRWYLHKLNSARIPQKHYGVQGLGPNNTVLIATVGYRDSNNVLYNREPGILSGYIFTHQMTQAHSGNNGALDSTTDKQCPDTQDVGSADFHFYGDGGNMTGHSHGCTWYFPNDQLGEGGYFVNKKTTIAFNGTSFPDTMAPGWKACLLNPEFIRRLADAALKKAGETGGAAPYAPITSSDARPGDATVQDLKDEPTTGTRPNGDPNAPPPPAPTPPPPPPPTGGTDLGPNPGIGSPTLEAAPTNILDPVFDWLPDLPSIQINTAGATCPTWQMQPFPGPEWHLVMDKHCPFIADNAALISTIMIIGFTVGSAMIILRA